MEKGISLDSGTATVTEYDYHPGGKGEGTWKANQKLYPGFVGAAVPYAWYTKESGNEVPNKGMARGNCKDGIIGIKGELPTLTENKEPMCFELTQVTQDSHKYGHELMESNESLLKEVLSTLDVNYHDIYDDIYNEIENYNELHPWTYTRLLLKNLGVSDNIIRDIFWIKQINIQVTETCGGDCGGAIKSADCPTLRGQYQYNPEYRDYPMQLCPKWSVTGDKAAAENFKYLTGKDTCGSPTKYKDWCGGYFAHFDIDSTYSPKIMDGGTGIVKYRKISCGPAP